MSKSMLEYLASLRQHGCTPQNIGEVTIGRTVYAAGSFDDPRNGNRTDAGIIAGELPAQFSYGLLHL
jgi:hypothetical protein